MPLIKTYLKNSIQFTSILKNIIELVQNQMFFKESYIIKKYIYRIEDIKSSKTQKNYNSSITIEKSKKISKLLKDDKWKVL